MSQDSLLITPQRENALLSDELKVQTSPFLLDSLSPHEDKQAKTKKDSSLDI